MKFVAILLLTIATFCGTTVAMLALTGNLSKEGIDRILNGPPPPETDPADAPDGLKDIAAALSEREAQLEEERKSLGKDREQLELAQRQNAELRTELQQLVEQLTGMLDTADTDRAARLQEVANSVAAMKPKNAANALKEWPPDQIAEILLLMDEDVRGKILNELDTEERPSPAGIILDTLQKSKY